MRPYIRSTTSSGAAGSKAAGQPTGSIPAVTAPPTGRWTAPGATLLLLPPFWTRPGPRSHPSQRRRPERVRGDLIAHFDDPFDAAQPDPYCT